MKEGAHFLHLYERIFGGASVSLDNLSDSVTVDILLENSLIHNIYLVKLRELYAERAESVIIPKLGLQLVAKGIVVAGLVVYLLESKVLSLALCKVGVSAFALAEKLNNAVFRAVYGKCFWKFHIGHQLIVNVNLNGLHSTKCLFNEVGEGKLVFLSQYLFKLGLCLGVLGGKYRTAILIGENRRLKSADLAR